MVKTGTLGDQAWQMVLNNNTECLEYLYTSAKHSDLDIIFPEDGVCIKAHRLILSMKSPVLDDMLMGPKAATGEPLTLPQDSHEVFRKLLDHTYLDRMDLGSVEEAVKVYALAHKYKMESAKKACVQMLNRDPDAVMSPEMVSHLNQETLRDLVKSDYIGFSSEAVPLKGLIAWGRAQLGPEEEPSGSAVREKIGDLLKEVRFLNMSCDEFVKGVFDTNVLTHTECFHIHRAISGADLSTLPEDIPLCPRRGGRCPELKKRCADLSTLPEDTPLCSTGGVRSPKIREKKGLFCSDYRIRKSDDRDKYPSSSRVMLVSDLRSSVTIEVHYVRVLEGCGGTIDIMDNELKIVGSATSEDMEFIFTNPVALQNDKRHYIVFYPKDDVELDILYLANGRNGNITLTWHERHGCSFYFCEPTRS
ncbi:BTB/POZ domain-containing protein 6-B-like [Oratosquilla oratoria]|uniref:BTB/POZ domain-containing protein 6-B-like n=1 Tax=Oratosquilla oratoria TaxID=337810 RepID=UPI003F770C1D